MATILLSAAGAALGGMTSGTVLGLSGAVLGRVAGAALGRVIDQKLLGTGSDPVERGRVERFRITGANEGAPVAQLFGRMRLGGQVIWATNFVETATTTTSGGGGKGAPAQPKTTTTTYSYSISLAVAICEGEIRRVGRIWADGVELDRSTVTMRIYNGGDDQMPDPLLEAVEGAGRVPAYRGIAYVVIEDLNLSDFGNRIPQFAFEVTRPARPARDLTPAASDIVKAVALMPGTGEYVLATQQVTYNAGFGRTQSANVSARGSGTDFTQSLRMLRQTVPNVRSVSLIYSWFGNDLRAGACRVRPKVEVASRDGVEMPWRAGGIARSSAQELARIDGRPVYGGTPADTSVIQAIRSIHSGGQEVLFYPFLLMEILAGNGLPDPWGGDEQPALPWRGRITGNVAPGLPGSTDQTAANASAVSTFFGTARARDFTISNGTVTYSGPAEWSYSRFILHCAALCAAAGGVEAFCIGSEMRGLTQMRDATGFPAVARFRALAAEVRNLLPGAKLSYAADWSEYFGYHPQDGSGDVFYHLDPLWADGNIDFIAIDNYMPLSDWRDGVDHADADWESEYALDYLKANIEGGEWYDWYYPSEEARAGQLREPITDGAYGEPWVYSYKALREWWSNPHFERRGGVRPHNLFRHSEAFDQGVWEAQQGALVTTDAADGPEDGARAAQLDLSNDPASAIAQRGVGQAGTYRVSVWARAVSGAQTFRFQCQNTVDSVQVSPDIALDTTWRRYDHVFTVSEASDFAIGNGADGAARSILIWGAQLEAGPDLSGYTRTGAVPVSLQPTAWVPQSKPIWFAEIGCAAVDKGTNQPNKFLDLKSSESSLPYFSTGRRDDLIQAQYLRAIMEYWSEPGRNPTSALYGGPMLDMDRAHVWAWDARPWPAFPNNSRKWSDGENWTRGHWVTGRIEAAPLDHVVAELCEAVGVTDYDVSKLYGLVRGHISGETESARARLQSLMMAFGFQAVEREGQLVFLPLPNKPVTVIEADWTALNDDGDGRITEIRASEAETTGRVRVGYTAAETEYEERLSEAVFPGDADDGVSASELPMAMTGPEGQAIAERWLAEARVARDALRFSLPPSQRGLGSGDMVALEDGSTWRIDRVEDKGVREVEAVRVEPSVSEPSDAVEEFISTATYEAPVPVSAVFMDLPLLTGEEVPHAPHLAVTAVPWQGSVAVYSSAARDGFALNRLMERGAIAGTLQTPLRAATPGLWDRSGVMRVEIAGGNLSGAEMSAVLNGSNAAAIGSGDAGDWEVIQFADATLVAPDTWEIGLRLRGQQGTDAVMPEVWPEGSVFVLLNGAPGQVSLPTSARGLERYWRIGPGRRSVGDPSYIEKVVAFQGVGLRPYAPAHLRATAADGHLDVSWIRRSRIDADSWAGLDVPLGETTEQYLLRVTNASGVRREELLSAPGFTYTEGMRASDGVGGPYQINVAQVSERFGPGPFARIDIHD